MKKSKSPSEDALTAKKPRSRKPWLWAIGLLILLLLGILLAVVLLPRPAGEPVIPDTPGMAMVEQMGPGWNLGNTLDSYSAGAPAGLESETSWGNPLTTQALLDTLKAAGFTTARIPATWWNHLRADGSVDPAWMDRVQEIVDYGYNIGMYVILNMHHDDDYGGYIPERKQEQEVTAQYTRIWAEIAERFRNYDEHLLFEAFNEPRVPGSLLEWGGGTLSQRNVINRLNAAFVETVRASSGNNAVRWLMLPTHAAARESRVMRALRLPDDDRLIVSIHAYYPRSFAMNNPDAKTYGEQERRSLEKMLGRIYDRFVKKGVPVYLGEFGAMDKGNTDDRVRYTADYTALAARYGMRCAWWDNGIYIDEAYGGESFALLDRRTLQWFYPEIAAAAVG